MSYITKIVERTLKVEAKLDSGSIKPAITPASIPEPFEIIAPPSAGTRLRRITAFGTSGSAKKKLADAARSVPDAKAAGEEERLPDQVAATAAAAAAPMTHRKQVAQAAPQDKAGAPNPIMMPGNEQAEVPTEKEKKPDQDFAAISNSAAPGVLDATTEVGIADRASQTRPLEANGFFSKNGAGYDGHHQQLRPATRADDKYSMTVAQPDETTITINIGRIEVRANSPVVEARPLPRKEYSPPLSLDEYLKQRMEGKKK